MADQYIYSDVIEVVNLDEWAEKELEKKANGEEHDTRFTGDEDLHIQYDTVYEKSYEDPIDDTEYNYQNGISQSERTYPDPETNILRLEINPGRPDPINDYYLVAMGEGFENFAANAIVESIPDAVKNGTWNAVYAGYTFRINFTDKYGKEYHMNVIQADTKALDAIYREKYKWGPFQSPTFPHPVVIEPITDYDPLYHPSNKLEGILDGDNNTAGVVGNYTTEMAYTIDDPKTPEDESGIPRGNLDFDKFFGSQEVRISSIEAFVGGYMTTGSEWSEIWYDIRTDRNYIPIPVYTDSKTGIKYIPDGQISGADVYRLFDPEHPDYDDGAIYGILGDGSFTDITQELKDIENRISNYPMPTDLIRLQIEYSLRDFIKSLKDDEKDESRTVNPDSERIRNAQFGIATSNIIIAAEGSMEATQKTTSPLVVDLSGDGFETAGKASGAYFDLDNNGFAEKTAWMAGDDNGFVVLDRNENGQIDSGAELFGNHTRLENGSCAKDGFEALAQYDTNNDGQIDVNDEIYSDLRVWIDNGDGKTADGELHTLDELGVEAIGLAQRQADISQYVEASISGISDAVFSDGETKTVADFWFENSKADTKYIFDGVISEEIAKLPDVRSMGLVPSLHAA
jgi:hypothetical protein